MFNPLPANYSPIACAKDEIIRKFIVGVLLQVIDPINKLIDTVEFDAVFYSLDWHPADHVSFIDNIKQRPIHPTSPVSILTTFIVRFDLIMTATHDCIINLLYPLHDDYCNLYRFMGVMTTKRYMSACMDST